MRLLIIMLAYCIIGGGIFIILCICEPNEKDIEWSQVGVFETASQISTSFNEQLKSNVYTSEGMFTVIGCVTGKKGTTVYLSNTEELCIEGFNGEKRYRLVHRP